MAKIRRSTNPRYKWEVTDPNGRVVRAGDPNYKIGPIGSPRADNYCARSSGIKDKGKWSANALARHMWGCRGKKSVKGTQGRVGGEY